MVQAEVKSNTWKESTTCFWPWYWLRVMFPSLTEGRVKSGATVPTSAGIFPTFFPLLDSFAPTVERCTDYTPCQLDCQPSLSGLGEPLNSATTGFRSTPMPGTSTSTTSPAFRALVVPVVPEKTRSPGWRVTCWLI